MTQWGRKRIFSLLGFLDDFFVETIELTTGTTGINASKYDREKDHRNPERDAQGGNGVAQRTCQQFLIESDERNKTEVQHEHDDAQNPAEAAAFGLELLVFRISSNPLHYRVIHGLSP